MILARFRALCMDATTRGRSPGSGPARSAAGRSTSATAASGSGFPWDHWVFDQFCAFARSGG